MIADTAERLQKALARLGLASRREAEEWIRAGRLTVNGAVASLGMKVRPSDHIRLDGRVVRQRPPAHTHVFLYHRSPGESLREAPVEDADSDAEFTGAADSDEEVESELAAAADRREPDAPRGNKERFAGTTGAIARGSGGYRAPLKDRLPKRAGRRFITISPMPNIDGGLELLSSDGALAERLQRSVRRLESEFSVRVHGELSDSQRKQIREGVLDRGTLEVNALDASGGEAANRWYTVQARGASGKDIRQLFERQGALVSRVLRTRLGPIQLGRQLARGQFRKLTDAELSSLTGATSNPMPAEGAPKESRRSASANSRAQSRERSRPPSGAGKKRPARATSNATDPRRPRGAKSRRQRN